MALLLALLADEEDAAELAAPGELVPEELAELCEEVLDAGELFDWLPVDASEEPPPPQAHREKLRAMEKRARSRDLGMVRDPENVDGQPLGKL